jgi:predicted NUDIX family NTP pyrophosphohydrolase
MSRMKASAGLLLYRGSPQGLEVLLVHPGGPFWKKKDAGAWSIPKGEYGEDEDPLAAARREFEEETGAAVEGEFLPLTPIRQKGGKQVLAWAVRADFDPSVLRSNLFSMEWPPRSGRQQEFPEVDRAEWFPLDAAREKILESQKPLLDELERRQRYEPRS